MTRYGLSQPVRRREDDRLLTGRGAFVDDLHPDGTLYALALRAPVAHARITALDTSAARAVPGVRLVLTAADLAGEGVQPIACIAPPRPRPGSRFREHAQPPRRQQAQGILGKQRVLAAEAAADGEAPRLCGDAPDNLSFEWEQGDRAAVEAAFAAAHHVSRLDLINNRVVLSAIETRGCLAEFDPAGADGRGKFTLTVATQMPNPMHKQLVQVLGVAPEQIRVRVPDVGGGFGGKNSLFPEYPLCLLAARRLGRPVKWVGQRSDAFITDFHGRDNVSSGAMAFDADGRIKAIRVHTYADLGGYTAGRGTVSPVNGLLMLSNTYRIPVMFAEVTAVHTSTVPTDPYRGAGRPEVLYLIERLMDLAASELGIDRVELRRRNLIPTDAFPYETPTGLRYDHSDFAAVMDAALGRADWDGIAARRRAAAARGRLRGIGMCTYVERCGGGAGLGEGGRLEFDADGGVTVYSGSQANGQGHETAFSQVVSHYLGLPFDKIRVVEGDTDRIATGTGTGGSWSTSMGGGAIAMAAELVIAKGKRIAAHLMEAAAGDTEFADGVFRVAGTDLTRSFTEVLAASRDPARLPRGETPGLDAEARFTPDNFTYPYGCHIAEVEVDPETGAVDLVAYVCVHDFGVALNPMLLAGQVHGGVVQGIGQALTEHTVYDDDGQLLSGSFMDYCLPRASDLPGLDFTARDSVSPQNLLGVKGCGEAGAAGSPPAVINAVVDALQDFGVRHIDMPATPQRVWAAIRSASGGRG